MNAYALDLRERVLRARRQGHIAHEIAKQFSLSKRSVERYWQRYQAGAFTWPKIAAILSVLATCRRLGIHPHDYLLAVLPKC